MKTAFRAFTPARRLSERLLPLLVTLALLLPVGGCGDDDAAADDTLPTAIRVDGAVFRDALGRQVLLRGYNARVDGIFDDTFDDGRVALDVIPPFAAAAAQRFEELGLNVLRLPVNWSGLEPHPQQYSEAYMRRVDAVVELGQRHHFYVLIDMHQDGYSKEIGQDGAPLWAIVPPPQMLLQGPLTDLATREASAQVLAAAGSFIANRQATDGRLLQDAFIAAASQLVTRYAGNPAVVGYEVINEPIAPSLAKLRVFYERFADMVHAIDADTPVFFEPIAFRNQYDQAEIPDTPWSHGPGVYAPHIYTTIFSPPGDGWASEDPTVLVPSVQAAVKEAAGWGTPLFVGEFGTDQAMDRGHRWLEAELDLQDQFAISSTAWVWAETGTWGLIDYDGQEQRGQERAATVQAMTRPYPRAVAGDLLAIERPAPGNLRVSYRASAVSAAQAHEVAVSADQLADYDVRCDGAPVAVIRRTGRAQFRCSASAGEHVFEVIGVPRSS